MKRFPLILFWILTATVVCSAQTTFYYPHIVDGLLSGTSKWKTTIFLTNPAGPGGITASGTITFTQENANSQLAGSSFANLSFADEVGAVSNGKITFTIPAGQTKKYVSAAAGAYAGGFATVAATQGLVNGTAIFSQFDLFGRLLAEAGVPQASAVLNQAIFVDTVAGYNIGVAYANIGSAAGSVTMSLIDATAVSVATTTQLLGPGNHGAAFTSQIFSPDKFPSVPVQLAGTMQIRSTVPLAAIALRFDPNFLVFTTLPPVTLASLINPAIEWLQQRDWLAPLSSVARLLGAFQWRVG